MERTDKNKAARPINLRKPKKPGRHLSRTACCLRNNESYEALKKAFQQIANSDFFSSDFLTTSFIQRMNPNWLGVTSAILAFVAFVTAYQTTWNKTAKTRMILAILASLTALPGASFAAYYAHVLPEPAWYYSFRSIPGTELLVTLCGVAGGWIATLLPRPLLILPLGGVTAFSMAPIIKPFIGPIADGEFKNEWNQGVCLQSTPSTCGAASTASIMKYLGVEATESELAAEAHSYAGGTEAWYLARATRARGFDAQFDFAPGFHPEGGLPAVVGVRIGSIGHFIAILQQEDDKFVVGDPLRGRESLSMKELEQRYSFTGFHMRVTLKARR